MSLRIETARRPDGTLVLSLAGELELATAPRLQEAVTAALTPAGLPLLLDLTSLTYIDSAGLGALLQAKRTALRQGSDLWLLGVGNQPWSRLVRSGLAGLLMQPDP